MSEHRDAQRDTLIASHRGGADLWPENSMTAFQNTTAIDTDQVEFDVHPTTDGSIVVHHDPVIDRMTDRTGEIVGQSYAELSAAIIKGTDNDRIPLLSEVVALFRATSIDLRLEIKANIEGLRYPGLEAAVSEILRAHEMLERTTITSFHIETLVDFRAVARDTPLIWLVNRIVFRQTGGIAPVLRNAADRGIGEIALHESDLTASPVAAARAAGIAIGAYAVNDEATIRRVWPLGLSAFTTNRPDIAVTVRAEISRRV